MKRIAFALALIAGPALAEDASAPAAPEPPKPVLTAAEGQKLVEYGAKIGQLQAAAAVAAADMKPILDKLAPAKKQ